MNIFETKLQKYYLKGNTKYFRDGSLRMELCLFMSPDSHMKDAKIILFNFKPFCQIFRPETGLFNF